MGFSEQLKIYRKKKNYTQQQIAEMLGLTKSTYSLYESGKVEPNVDRIRKLANILGTSSDILLETDFEEITQEEKNLIATIRKLNEADQKEVINFVDYKNSKTKTTPPDKNYIFGEGAVKSIFLCPFRYFPSVNFARKRRTSNGK